MPKPDPKPSDLDVILARMEELEILLLNLTLALQALKELVEKRTGGDIHFG